MSKLGLVFLTTLLIIISLGLLFIKALSYQWGAVVVISTLIVVNVVSLAELLSKH